MSKLGLDIKSKIDFNNKLIEDLLVPNKFVLNNSVNQLLKENSELQAICPHEYDEEGACIYCYKLKETEDI